MFPLKAPFLDAFPIKLSKHVVIFQPCLMTFNRQIYSTSALQPQSRRGHGVQIHKEGWETLGRNVQMFGVGMDFFFPSQIEVRIQLYPTQCHFP